MKVLLICAIFCVTLRISTLQPIVKREVDDYDEGPDDDSNEQEFDGNLVIPASYYEGNNGGTEHREYSSDSTASKSTVQVMHSQTPYMSSPPTYQLHSRPTNQVYLRPSLKIYFCPRGYTLRGTNCYLRKVRAKPVSENLISRDPPCPYGYYLIGNFCYPYNGQNTQDPPYNPYTNPNFQNPPPTPPPICPPGYQLFSGMCYYTYNNPYTIYSG